MTIGQAVVEIQIPDIYSVFISDIDKAAEYLIAAYLLPYKYELVFDTRSVLIWQPVVKSVLIFVPHKFIKSRYKLEGYKNDFLGFMLSNIKKRKEFFYFPEKPYFPEQPFEKEE